MLLSNATSYRFCRGTQQNSLTAALDQLRVVASSTSNDPEEGGYELSGIVRGGWRDRAVATATWYSGTHSPSKAVTNFSNRRRPHRNSKSMGATWPQHGLTVTPTTLIANVERHCCTKWTLLFRLCLRFKLIRPTLYFNPLECNDNYSATI